MIRTITSYVALSGVLLSLGGCHTMPSGNTTSVDRSLYDRLGGKPAITAVVDDFVGRVATDT